MRCLRTLRYNDFSFAALWPKEDKLIAALRTLRHLNHHHRRRNLKNITWLFAPRHLGFELLTIWPFELHDIPRFSTFWHGEYVQSSWSEAEATPFTRLIAL